jgi:hypothetical protein
VVIVVPSRVHVGPPRPALVLDLANGLGGRGQGVGRVIAEQLEVAAGERVERSVGQLVQVVVEVQQRAGIVGELEPAAVTSGGDLGDERVRAKSRPGRVEAVDEIADPVPELVAERPVGRDLPAGADGVERERRRTGRHRDASLRISWRASLKPSGVPLDPARRETRTSSMRLPVTTSGTASAKRCWKSSDVGLVALLLPPLLPFSEDAFEQPAPIRGDHGKGGQRP